MVQNSRGSVLIFVLVFMAFILFLGSIQAGHSLIEARVAGNYMHNAQAYYAAEAGIEAALALLQADAGLLNQNDYFLQGTIGAGFFEVRAAANPDGATILTSRGFAANAREVIQVEVGFSDFPAGEGLAIQELVLQGAARIEGGLHVNAALTLSQAENSLAGPFSFSGSNPVFAPGASLFLEDFQVTATHPLDLNPYKVQTGQPVFSFNSDFYRGKGYQAFPTLAEYLLDDEMALKPLKKVRITNQLNTTTLSDNFSFHGIIVVTSSHPVILAGSINAQAPDQGNQLVIVAAQSQDIILCPTPAGDLQLGGTFFLLTRGSITLQGPAGSEAETLRLHGAVSCRRLSIADKTFVYDPSLKADILQELKDLPLLRVRWLRAH